ncbi:DUF3319 domain-containing protein [Photobacterium aphoticum]|uniref:DUF3319 domain-containing protein n=1 Tax=Photobacterium aphoticum TaxID=754436 RepID=A0A0J1GQS1_9GAMM|nr:DUF3319 domain-containing protein [Photobacterium aphoticum]KLV02006.1 hypothetical protein ABT58_06375 [Photobacterium aphoticum]PSU60251.1 DUF3319 domain-containing protein [Photobacterium aphoticum]GHA34371.1 tail protein [Photobacterium aphoticum]
MQKKQLLHRGHRIENVNNREDGWSAVIEGRTITHKLSLVKKSIDWWYEMNTFMPPEKFESIVSKKQPQQLTMDYKGFKLRNDTGYPNDWYVMAGTRLLKGHADAIKRHIDAALQRSASR